MQGQRRQFLVRQDGAWGQAQAVTLAAEIAHAAILEGEPDQGGHRSTSSSVERRDGAVTSVTSPQVLKAPEVDG